jgi:hypothetical protein
MTLGEIASRLERVRWRGPDRFVARCPAHDDRSPSLSVRAGDRRILMYCFAGCSVDDICRALGLSRADLCEQPRPPHQPAQPGAAPRPRRHRTADLAEDLTIRSAHRTIAAYTDCDISQWTDAQIDAAMARLAFAYAVLDRTGA